MHPATGEGMPHRFAQRWLQRIAGGAQQVWLAPWLEERGIYSRGRFGGWKYEVSNMDHSVMQGVEWAERMVQGQPEKTYTWK